MGEVAALIDPSSCQKDHKENRSGNQLQRFPVGSRASEKAENDGQGKVTQECCSQKTLICHSGCTAQEADYCRISKREKADTQDPGKTMAAVVIIPSAIPVGNASNQRAAQQPPSEVKIQGCADKRNQLSQADSQNRAVDGAHNGANPNSGQPARIDQDQTGDKSHGHRP